jgi:hypothetical protein
LGADLYRETTCRAERCEGFQAIVDRWMGMSFNKGDLIMNCQQLVEAGYQYVSLQHNKNPVTIMSSDGNTTKSTATILKIAVVTDDRLKGYKFDHTEGENNRVAVFNQV